MRHNTTVVDLSNIVYATYHRTSQYMSDRPLEHQVNEIISTVVQSVSLAAEHTDASVLICATDRGGRPQFRKNASPDYKANRGTVPEAVTATFGAIESVLENFGIPCLSVLGYEADDIFAQLVRYHKDYDRGPITGVSRDNDWTLPVAWARGTASLFDQMKKTTTHYHHLVDSVGDEFSSEKLADDTVFEHLVIRKCLMGDSSDNIVGFKGVGRKTADILACALIYESHGLRCEYEPYARKLDNFKKKHPDYKERLDINRTLIDPYVLLKRAPVVKALTYHQPPAEISSDEEVMEALHNPKLSAAIGRFHNMKARYNLIEAGDISGLPKVLRDMVDND